MNSQSMTRSIAVHDESSYAFSDEFAKTLTNALSLIFCCLTLKKYGKIPTNFAAWGELLQIIVADILEHWSNTEYAFWQNSEQI